MNDSASPKPFQADLFFVDEGDLAQVKHSFGDKEPKLDGPVGEAGWHVGLVDSKSGKIDVANGTLRLGELGRNALVEYFSSSRFRGIGEQSARRIVHGLDRGELIALLRGKKGGLMSFLGGKKADHEELDVSEGAVSALVAKWKEGRDEHAWSIMMHQLRFTPQQRYVIREDLGAGVIRMLRENPFQLLGRIPRFDFDQAIGLCERLGIEVTDEEKILAATKYWLKEKVEGQRRNTCGSLKRTVEEVSRMVRLDRDVVLETLTMSRNGFHFAKRDGKEYLSTIESARRDAALARELKRLVTTDATAAGKLFKAESVKASVDLSDEQRKAIALAVENPLSIVTGGPGSGKTAMVQGLVSALERQGKQIRICAPTGRAAKRITEVPGLGRLNPSTIHLYLAVNEEREAPQDFMIIDECSMIDIDLMVRLLKSVPDGCSVVFIGDADQLPPVGPGQPFKDMIEFSGKDESGQIPLARLTGNFRQDSQSETVGAAHAVINGRVPAIGQNLEASDFVFFERPVEEQCDTILELYFKTLPAMLDNEVTDNQILAPQRTKHVGITRLNSMIQSRLHRDAEPVLTRRNGEGEMRIYLDDKVINGENNYQRGVMNGDVGRVLDAGRDYLTVGFDAPGSGMRTVKFPTTGKIVLEPAYALTIHKSQGSEYPGVIIPVTGANIHMLSRSLLYTAITRGKRKVCLVGEREALEKALDWYTKDARSTLLAGELARSL